MTAQDDNADKKADKKVKESTLVKAKTPARVRAVASPATTAARPRTPARQGWLRD